MGASMPYSVDFMLLVSLEWKIALPFWGASLQRRRRREEKTRLRETLLECSRPESQHMRRGA